MAEEIKTQEKETSASASEENETQETEEEKSGETEETSKETETVDYKPELETEKELHGKTKETLGKAEERIVKLKRKLKENDIPDEDEGGGLSEETVKEVVTSAVKDAVRPLEDRLGKTEGQLSEALRANKSKSEVSQGGGEGGKKLPIIAKPPKLTPQDQTLVSKYGLKWDANKINPETNEKGVYVDKNGMVYPLVYRREGDVRKTIKAQTL